MHRYYEVTPVSKVVNVPPRVKEVLDTRWKFVLIEVGRGRDLTSASKRCVRCEQFAANHDSVDCAVCKNTYHMRCVRPPLLKKPARGFAWACAACSRKQELRLEARNTPTLSESAQTGDDDPMEDEDDEAHAAHETRESSMAPEPHPPPTAAQIAQANLWPWRYLGVHSRVEDALDYDDRIYPRASSRLGPRHQANVNVWHGRPIELVKTSDIKKRYLKHAGSKKDGKMTKETLAAIEAEKESKLKRPKWVVDEPLGYVARGEDEPIELKGKKEYTAQLIFKMPDSAKFTERGADEMVQHPSAYSIVDEYMRKVKPIAAQYDVRDCSTDFLTLAVQKLQDNDYDIENALAAMKTLSKRADLKLPELNREEVKRFEEGVQKYGSELHAVARHVGGNIKESRIVRYYYMWKKSDRGRLIWGNYEGRKSKKESKRAASDGTGKLVDDVADDADDSAFDNEKALVKKRGFACKFCDAQSSRQWRRAPQTAPGTLVPRDQASKNSKDKSNWLTLALCGRCAYLWRRYAIQYESIEEISKKIAAAGGRASKRRIDEELLRTIFEAQEVSGDLISMHLANEVYKSGMEVPQNIVQLEEPPKKKAKSDKDTGTSTPEIVTEKKRTAEKAPELPLEPEPPRVRIHPCAVCHVIEVPGQELLKCRDCRLHVHNACYGIGAKATTRPWFCDMCRNDHNLQVSTIYECLLCPVINTPQELMEPLKVSHKKKSDREREKERLEREMVNEATRRWRQEQEAAGRPVNPREALKRTAWNNWIHITCALWTKEIKFANAELLDDAEGVGFIPADRYEPQCKICRQAGKHPTVTCNLSSCNAQFHIGCAHLQGYIFGFDVAPVKGSRRDSVNIVKFDHETGTATPGVWCPHHAPPTLVHSMVEQVEGGLTALQLFARTYKQADQSITGTVRRAAQFTSNLAAIAPPVQPPQRHNATVNGMSYGQSERFTSRALRESPAASPSDVDEMDVDRSPWKTGSRSQKKCCSCLVDASPKWWPVARVSPERSVTPPPNGIPTSDRLVPNGYSQADHSPHTSQPGPISSQQDTVMSNGIVKTEPSDAARPIAAPYAPGDPMWQCHKCHVGKVAPPSSPSQIRPRQRPPPEPVADVLTYDSPTYTQAPAPFSYSARPPEIPAHSHPGPSPVITHHSPWPGGPPQWSAPVMRNGPAPPPTGPAPMSAYAPTSYASDYQGGPYPRPGPPVPFSAAPPPRPPHHSPPPGPYVMSHPHPPSHAGSSMSGRPPSPPRHPYDYHPTSSGLGIAAPSSRPYATDPPRRESIGSPVNGYAHPPLTRPFAAGPPSRAGSNHVHYAQIAQAASDFNSAPHHAHGHARQPSADGAPRLGSGHPPRVSDYPSPTMLQRPLTPGDPGRLDERDRPGASASPSLRNLLS
jgi:PHD-zinc-finger like domain/PHD-finger